jgi:hypothetical protein
MEEAPVPQLPPAETPRPQVLTVLCILTFIWSGLNLISSLAIGVFFDVFIEFASRIAEQYKWSGMEMITSSSPAFFFVSSLFFAGSIAGAMAMWKMRRTGFHIYSISQILLIIAPMYFFRQPAPSVFDVLTSGLFIILYSSFLKRMS